MASCDYKDFADTSLLTVLRRHLGKEEVKAVNIEEVRHMRS